MYLSNFLNIQKNGKIIIFFLILFKMDTSAVEMLINSR